MRFVDSNVWLYAFRVGTDLRKKQLAGKSVAGPAVTISTQVINEVCFNLKRKAGLTEAEIQRLIHSFYQQNTVVPVNEESMLKAGELRSAYSLSFWDSQLLACALLAGCTTFESEDMQDGLVIEGALRISNPFKP